jgi:hypothetical protein
MEPPLRPTWAISRPRPVSLSCPCLTLCPSSTVPQEGVLLDALRCASAALPPASPSASVSTSTSASTGGASTPCLRCGPALLTLSQCPPWKHSLLAQGYVTRKCIHQTPSN